MRVGRLIQHRRPRRSPRPSSFDQLGQAVAGEDVDQLGQAVAGEDVDQLGQAAAGEDLDQLERFQQVQSPPGQFPTLGGTAGS